MPWAVSTVFPGCRSETLTGSASVEDKKSYVRHVDVPIGDGDDKSESPMRNLRNKVGIENDVALLRKYF